MRFRPRVLVGVLVFGGSRSGAGGSRSGAGGSRSGTTGVTVVAEIGKDAGGMAATDTGDSNAMKIPECEVVRSEPPSTGPLAPSLYCGGGLGSDGIDDDTMPVKS